MNILSLTLGQCLREVYNRFKFESDSTHIYLHISLQYSLPHNLNRSCNQKQHKCNCFAISSNKSIYQCPSQRHQPGTFVTLNVCTLRYRPKNFRPETFVSPKQNEPRKRFSYFLSLVPTLHCHMAFEIHNTQFGKAVDTLCDPRSNIPTQLPKTITSRLNLRLGPEQKTAREQWAQLNTFRCVRDY